MLALPSFLVSRAFSNGSPRFRRRVPLSALLCLAPLATPQTPRAQAATTERVNVSSSETQGTGQSFQPAISGDGRYVAFLSTSSLVADDTNGFADVYVRDRQAGTTIRANVSSDEVQANNQSQFPGISSDGRYVTFGSFANNLAPGDTNGYYDTFVRDLQTGTTTRISVSTGGVQGDRASFAASISDDGRYAVFESQATNLVSSDSNGAFPDVFLRDLQANTTTLVSRSTAGVQGDSSSAIPRISGNGRYVVFLADATNLVSGDTNNRGDVFVRDLQTNTTTRESVSSAEGQVNLSSTNPSISADGRYVAFESDAAILVSGDTNNEKDIFVRDRVAGTTVRVSLSSAGAQGDAYAEDANISANGRFVAFEASASTLVAGDTNVKPDIFVRDLQTNTTTRVSVSSSGVQGDDVSDSAAISGNGSVVAFHSFATNLVSVDTNNQQDIFVRDGGPITPSNTRPQNVSISPNGTLTNAPNDQRPFRALYRDANGASDIKLAYIQVGTNTRFGLRAAYDRAANKLYLLNDAGTGYIGGFAPGSANVISNLQGRLQCTDTDVVTAGTDLQIDWNLIPREPLALTPAGSGAVPYPVQLYVTDNGGLSDGFDIGAKWIISGNSAPVNLSITPTTATDPINKARTFRATYTDANGFSNIRLAYIQVKSGSTNVLRAAYDVQANKLYLFKPDGSGYAGGVTLGTNTVLTNTIGSLSCVATKVAAAGNNLQIDWVIAAKAPLVGTQPVLLYVQDRGNKTDGFDQGATWTISSAP